VVRLPHPLSTRFDLHMVGEEESQVHVVVVGTSVRMKTCAAEGTHNATLYAILEFVLG